MAPLRALLVDDEPIARRVLREELEDLHAAEVAGEAENGTQALDQIERLNPDIVFLDLQMPEMNGFEVIRNLPPNPPTIVIVTAFDQHAIQAFDAGAIDYLLKPVSQGRLKRCLDRVKTVRRDTEASAVQSGKLQEIAERVSGGGRSGRIVGKLGEEYHLLSSDQVLAFQAERELVWIITRKQRYLATQPLKNVQSKVADLNFARIHRNTLVNLDHVAKMAPLSSQRWLLTLANQLEFVVSKRQARAVQRLLRW